ncbi:hypothetical protein IGI04_033146 [Brassica rapa subsp. trilocularis]|uniref:Uncharacterized protein n=1 Tax=Brassica rapa subsp. trilocularis TaxID=1813537 RepID=A0ABQ7L517_BRACM|nr:hypothetical protein IGI04_033146 [Brassica rapa subsp. trilocularis]
MRDSISAASILRRRDSCVPKPPSFSSHHRRIHDNLAVKTSEPFNSTSAPTFACADGSPSTADYNSEIDRFDQTRDLAGPSS